MKDEFEPPAIRCAICDKPVESVSVGFDLAEEALVITVYCHGAKDRMSIPQLMVLDMPAHFLWGEGVAFDQKALPASVKAITDARRR